jgi:hypothetical protein
MKGPATELIPFKYGSVGFVANELASCNGSYLATCNIGTYLSGPCGPCVSFVRANSLLNYSHFWLNQYSQTRTCCAKSVCAHWETDPISLWAGILDLTLQHYS